MKQSISDPHIIKCLKEDYGIEVISLTFLPIGAGENTSVYKARNGSMSYFVKLIRDHQHDISFVIAELLHEAGIQEIIPPIKTIHGQLAQRMDQSTLIVYPFVEGQDGFSRNLTDDQWRKLGRALRQIHEVHVPPAIQNLVRREDYSPKWREVVRSLYRDIDKEPAGDKIALQLSQFMKKNQLTILRLVDQAEKLGQNLIHQSPNFVLCHSDIHGGNVLMDGNNTIYIVDWDAPMMAPKERDLMFIGGGVGNVWNKPHEEELFYQGYGKTEINPAILSYYRLERIVEDIAIYGQELLLTSAGGQERHIKFKHFIDMFASNGVVEIALKPIVS